MMMEEVHRDTSHSPSVDWRREPIFIVGIMPRSGTNFLHRLLCQHPDCGAVNTTPVREDYFLHHIEGLDRFVGRLRWQWGHWGADEAFVQGLADRLGLGASAFLKSLSPAPRIVTKTPSVANLDRFGQFFRHAALLVIVRDGRSLVASGMSGFGWSFETATREWARAARTILRLQRVHGEGMRMKVVSYERLSADTVACLNEILAFVGLDASVYNFEQAAQTPIYGSSFESREGDGLTWKPRDKPAHFDASSRWKSWSRYRHARFNWIAGKEMRALGYETEDVKGGIVNGAMVHGVLDLLYHLRRWPGRLVRSSREAAKAFLGSLRGRAGEKTDLRR